MLNAKCEYDNSVGSGWQQVEGDLAWISLGSYGQVWGVHKQGNIWRREGVTEANPTGSSWKQVPGELSKVSVWGGWAWGVNKDLNIFYKEVQAGMSNDCFEFSVNISAMKAWIFKCPHLR